MNILIGVKCVFVTEYRQRMGCSLFHHGCHCLCCYHRWHFSLCVTSSCLWSQVRLPSFSIWVLQVFLVMNLQIGLSLKSRGQSFLQKLDSAWIPNTILYPIIHVTAGSVMELSVLLPVLQNSNHNMEKVILMLMRLFINPDPLLKCLSGKFWGKRKLTDDISSILSICSTCGDLFYYLIYPIQGHLLIEGDIWTCLASAGFLQRHLSAQLKRMQQQVHTKFSLLNSTSIMLWVCPHVWLTNNWGFILLCRAFWSSVCFWCG
jgi:hypothetical protein